MDFDTFVDLLDDVHRTSCGVRAQCPGHDDHDPSMGASKGNDGRILVHCFAGCTVEEICDALGIHVRDLFPAQNANPQVRQNARLNRERERQKRHHELHLKGCRIDLIRESEWMVRAAHDIDISVWSPERLHRELNRLANAYTILEKESRHEH